MTNIDRRRTSTVAQWILGSALGLAGCVLVGCGGAEVKPPPGVEDSATSLDVSIDGDGDKKTGDEKKADDAK